MGNNIIKKEVEFDFSGKIEKLQSSLSKITKEMGNVKIPEKTEAKMLKTIKKIEDEISDLQSKTQGNKAELIDEKKIAHNAKKIKELFATLQLSSAQMGKNSGMQGLIRQTKEYKRKLEEIKKLSNTLSSSQKLLNTKKSKRNDAIIVEQDVKNKKAGNIENKKQQKQTLINERQELLNSDKYIKAKTSSKKTEEDKKVLLKEELLRKNISTTEEELKNLQDEFEKTFTSKEIKQLDSEIKDLETNIGKIVSSYRALSKGNSLEPMKEKLSKIGIDASGIDSIEKLEQVIAGLTPEQIESLNSEFAQLEKELKNGTETANKFNENIKEDFHNVVEEAGKANKAFSEISQQMKMFFGLSNSIQLFKKAVNNAFESVKELDSAMTEIAVVSDYSISDMWKSLPDFTKRANELGVAITDVYDATGLYVQQGLDLVESQGLANETLKMARIAGIDAASATDAMTAALRAFNMELDEDSAQKVNDIYSKLAAITAADVQEISTAMSKTASIAASAGASIENTSAFLSQIIETTRESAETAGTALVI